jgi:hypothetical protein
MLYRLLQRYGVLNGGWLSVESEPELLFKSASGV